MLIRFPQDEAGKQRKLSRPWHGPYRIAELNDPDVTVVKVYFTEEGPLQVYQLHVCQCPPGLLVGFYWYGGTRKSSGQMPQWVEKMVEQGPCSSSHDDDDVVGDVLTSGRISNTPSYNLQDRVCTNPPEKLDQT